MEIDQWNAKWEIKLQSFLKLSTSTLVFEECFDQKYWLWNNTYHEPFVAISIFVSDMVTRKYNMNACFNLLVLQLLKKAVQRTLGFYYLYNVFSAFYKDTGFMGS